MFKTLSKIYLKLFGTEYLSEKQRQPSIHFQRITLVNKTPKNDEVGFKDFIEVVYQNKPLWTLFRCPCGCGHVISLSLQKVHNPYWKVHKSDAGRPTVYPSVWQTKGCKSHFWVKDGRIYWVPQNRQMENSNTNNQRISMRA